MCWLRKDGALSVLVEKGRDVHDANGERTGH